MNRNEKNLKSRQKIIAGAQAEFGEKSYSEASLNNICTANGISKGIIYHYFKDKDELYLVCVQECFDALTIELSILEFSEGHHLEQTLQSYFDARLSFFSRFPYFFKIFCDAVAVPPVHLREAIADIKKEFDAFNIEILTRLLEQVKLRNTISIEEAVSYIYQFQNFFNFQYQKEFECGINIGALSKQHEESCKRFLDIILHGMIARD